MEKYFIDIPIYRCTPSKQKSEIEKLKLKVEEEFILNKKYLTKQEFKNNVIDEVNRRSCIFEYNEIIGWLKLYVIGSQIRGRSFFECNPQDGAPKKRIDKAPRKKVFTTFHHDRLRVNFNQTDSSDEIYEKLIHKIEYITTSDKRLSKRYVDLEMIKNIGSFVDWRNLVDELNEFNS